jgi:hypothetical protein
MQEHGQQRVLTLLSVFFAGNRQLATHANNARADAANCLPVLYRHSPRSQRPLPLPSVYRRQLPG